MISTGTTRARITALGCAALAVGSAGIARAAIELDRAMEQGDFNSSELTFPATIGPGEDRYLLVAVVTSATPAIQSVSWAGSQLGFIGQAISPAANCQLQWWGLVAPADGTHPFRVELASATTHLSAALISYRGVAAVGAVGTFVAARGPVGPSVVNAASTAGEQVVDGVCGWAPDSLIETAGGNQVARWHWSSGSLSSAGSQKAGAPSVTMSWTQSGPGAMEWAAAVVALRPAGVVPSVPLDVTSAGCAVAEHQQPPGAAPVLAVLCFMGLWAVRRAHRRPHGAGTFPGRWRVTSTGTCVQARHALPWPRTPALTSTRSPWRGPRPEIPGPRRRWCIAMNGPSSPCCGAWWGPTARWWTT